MPAGNLTEHITQSFGGDQFFDVTKFFVAESANQQQMFRLTKFAEPFAVFDDFARRFRTDVRQFFKLFGGGRVNVYHRRGGLAFSFDQRCKSAYLSLNGT